MLSNKQKTKWLACSVLLALLVGCSAFPDEQAFSERGNDVRIPEKWQATSEFVNDQFSKQLLDLVNQPQVAQLVEEVLIANYDLKVTAARLRQAQLLSKQAEMQEEPSLNFNYQASRKKQGSIQNSQSLSLDLSWEIDIWGRLADASDAALASSKASELDYVYARNSLTARVIQAWLDIHYRAQIIAVEEHWITSLNHTEAIIREQVLDGEKERADLDAAKATTERTRSTLAARKQSQIVAIRSFNILRGVSTRETPISPTEIAQIAAPPIKLPGEVIGSRPDLLAAYQRIISADKDTSVAYKQLLPKFNLTGSVSRTGESMHQLLDSSSAWSLLGGITAPLFNRESLKANAEVKALDAEIAYLNYQKLLLNAVNEVENAFDQEASLKMQEQHLSKAYEYSFASMQDYQNLYQDGASGVLELLTAKQAAFQAKIQLLETEQARFSNRITLGLALGMGV
ncbi:TolC family protein [Vibrio sp. RE88]|uniref:TolC family protein n=1 Tax=Vibrio sp. RE88 TaxID=2607610 RepID=UPI0014937BF0|nr:TolC family protein [Vibrio sp. RE88]NOH61888.1 transporter [Vibrio sp. RE88]